MGLGVVSIIIPVYNAEKFLSSCVDSILNQTYKELELILINDGSTDHTGEICNLYSERDERVKVIHQVNSGPSVARNKGIQMAKGRFIQFVDSDDYINSNMTEELVSNIMDDKVDIVVCGYNIMNLSKKGKQDNVKVKPNKEVALTQKEFIEKFGVLFESNFLNFPWNKLYRADIIKDNNLTFNESIKWGEDLIFNLQYFDYCKAITIIDKQLYNYIINSTSITSSFNKDLFRFQKEMYKEVKQFLSKHHSFTGVNKKIFECKFTNGIIMCLTNLFHANANISLRDIKFNMKKILHDPLVTEHAHYLKSEGIQKKALSLLIKSKSTNGILWYFKVKKLFKGQ